MATTSLPPSPLANDHGTSTSDLLTIAQVAKRTGLSEPVLRVWEARYGWPQPQRAANGYRRYPIALIAVLEQIAQQLRCGRTIGDLLRDPQWQPVMESGRLPAVKARMAETPDWSQIPLPETASGREVRARLERALVTKELGLIAWAQAEAGRLRPLEREHAVFAVLRLWHQHHSAIVQENCYPL